MARNENTKELETIRNSFMEGQARFRENENEGKLQVKFSIFQPKWSNVNVLDTDYSSYAVLYSCNNSLFCLRKSEYAWVMTRRPLDVNYPDDKLDYGNPDVHEWSRIRNIAKNKLESNAPGFDFDGTM